MAASQPWRMRVPDSLTGEPGEGAGALDVLRYTAFTADPAGGNPAGVVLTRPVRRRRDAAIAADVGYSETAFSARRGRRFSATSARTPRCRSAVTRRSRPASRSPSAHGPGELRLPHPGGHGAGHHRATTAGQRHADQRRAARRRPAATTRRGCWPRWAGAPPTSTRRCRRGSPTPAPATRARRRDPRAAGRPRLRLRPARRADGRAGLDDRRAGLARGRDDVFHARNPFPPGGVVEDPATGAAAAAFGGYLRELGWSRRRRRSRSTRATTWAARAG